MCSFFVKDTFWSLTRVPTDLLVLDASLKTYIRQIFSSLFCNEVYICITLKYSSPKSLYKGNIFSPVLKRSMCITVDILEYSSPKVYIREIFSPLC